MAKYSEEFKMKFVTEYVDGNIGIDHWKNTTWVASFLSLGGLKKKNEKGRLVKLQKNCLSHCFTTPIL